MTFLRLFLTALITAPLITFAADLSVSVTQLHERGGRLAWALFADADSFPSQREKALQKGILEIPKGAQSASFEMTGVGQGSYALAVFQDFDGDTLLKKNFLGIPREPIGFSRNPRVRFGPPYFDSARFVVSDDAPMTLEIRMIRD